MKKFNILLVINLAIGAVWCVYTLIVFIDFFLHSAVLYGRIT
jgi:hypothetical protein